MQKAQESFIAGFGACVARLRDCLSRLEEKAVLPAGHGVVRMPTVEEEIAHLRARAAQFVALAKEHPDNDRGRQRLMTVAADLYTKAAELEEKLKRGAA
jgi:hypothetical protein